MGAQIHELAFDARCHSADAIQRAAYRYIDKLSANIFMREAEIVCLVTFDSKHEAGAERYLHDLRKEVLDQVLRERIRLQTEPTRNFILALAFSKAGLIEEPSQ